MYYRAMEHDGCTFRVETERDADMGAPWDECDGHGTVSEWTTRDKQPGELVLNEDRGSKRFYDFAEACKTALRDGWGFLPETVRVERPGGYRLPTYRCGDFKIVSDDANTAYSELHAMHRATFPSARAYAAGAARADYEQLRDWCNDQWCYDIVTVTLVDDDGVSMGETESLGGVDDIDPFYLETVARELADEIIARVQDIAA
jgi:hypothetical protein